MNRIKLLLAQVVALLVVASPAFAEGEGGGVGDFQAIGAAIGIGLAALGGALGQGRVAAAALEGIGRNPSAADKMFIPMIIGLALVESLVLYAFVISIMTIL